MSFNYSPKVLTDPSLILYLDAANPRSYVSGSTVWYDLTRNGYALSASTWYINGVPSAPTMNPSNGGSILFYSSGTTFTFMTPNQGWPSIQTPNSGRASGELKIGTGFTIDFWMRNDPSLGPSIAPNHSIIGSGFSDTSINFRYYSILSEAAAVGSGFYNLDWFTLFGGASNNFTNATSNIWMNAVYVRNGNSVSVYVNGSLYNCSNTAYTANVQCSGSSFNNPILYMKYLGENETSSGFPGNPFATGGFRGALASLKIYNRILSESEIKRNYQTLRTRFRLTRND